MTSIDLPWQERHLGFRLSRYGVKEFALSTSHGIALSIEEGFPVISRGIC